MVLRNMTNEEAAVLLIDMISDLRVCGYDNQSYHNAVVVACAELMKNTEEKVPTIFAEPEREDGGAHMREDEP